MKLQENIQRIKEMMGVEHNPKKIILEAAITGGTLSNDQVFVDYLKRVEGFKDKAYDDQDPSKTINAGDTIKGVLTIGYGHTGPDVKPGDTISEEDATIKLKKDIDIHFDRAYQYVSTNYPGRENKLNLEQWEMLTDFAFNPGLSKFPKFAKAVLYKNWNLAVKEYKRYFNGEELTGRNREFYEMFLMDKDTSYKELGKGKSAANNITTTDGKPLDQKTYCSMLDGAPQFIAWIGKIMRYAELYVEANKLKNDIDLSLNIYVKRYYPELTNIGVTPQNWDKPSFCKT
jgi:GH24 family phage-related lysozyme (muramidase)